MNVIPAKAGTYRITLRTKKILAYASMTGRCTPITPSEVAESIVISQIPLMVGRISVKSEDLFERQRVIVA